MVFTKKEKIPIEELQKQHLTGPANEPIEKVAADMGVDQLVVVTEVPRYEKIIFRNQRDPGHVLEFHFQDKQNPFKMYKLIDGHQYELPIAVIKNLESCRENIEKYRRNADGIPEVYVAGYKTHFVCERV